MARTINVGIVGCGRISSTLEMPGLFKLTDLARIAAVCDLDSKRLAFAKQRVETEYKKRLKTDS